MASRSATIVSRGRCCRPPPCRAPAASLPPSLPLSRRHRCAPAVWDDGIKAVSPAAKVGTLETRIADNSGDAAVLWQDAQHRFIQVYTGQAKAGLVAVEPMSGSTDCFNNGDGLVVLQAGEEWYGAFGVKMAEA